MPSAESVGKTSCYARATVELRSQLAQALSPETSRTLHQHRALRHFVVLARMIAVLAASTAGAALFDRWYAWLPCSILSGFTLFGFTVMLHEVVHNAVFDNAPAANRFLGLVYAFPSVPFYNLRKVHMLMRPFYAERGMRATTYRQILFRWFVENRAPHTDWSADERSRAGTIPGSA